MNIKCAGEFPWGLILWFHHTVSYLKGIPLRADIVISPQSIILGQLVAKESLEISTYVPVLNTRIRNYGWWTYSWWAYNTRKSSSSSWYNKCTELEIAWSSQVPDLFVGQLRLGGVDDAPVAVEGDDDDGERRQVDSEAGRSLDSFTGHVKDHWIFQEDRSFIDK